MKKSGIKKNGLLKSYNSILVIKKNKGRLKSVMEINLPLNLFINNIIKSDYFYAHLYLDTFL